MLLPHIFLLHDSSDGPKRFHDFIEKNPCFSVQLVASSNLVRTPGSGTFVVKRPASFRLQMNWGAVDYTCIKNPNDSLDFERYDKLYQQYEQTPGLMFYESSFSQIQMDSLPLPLIYGEIKRFLGGGEGYKLTGHANGGDVYTASWTGATVGKAIATLGSDGRMLAFDYLVTTETGSTHRVFNFSNYVINPAMKAATFDTTPPLGFSSFELPLTIASVHIGQPIRFGQWKSRSGKTNVDPVATSKLVIVRVPDSPPADALIAYLKRHKMPVKTVVLSLGNTGGEYNSPPAAVASELSSVGTPFLVYVGPNHKVVRMWMGFDAENPVDYATEIRKALREKD